MRVHVGVRVAALGVEAGHGAHVEVLGLDVGRSSHVSGIETVPRGRPRTDHAEATVRSRAAWL